MPEHKGQNSFSNSLPARQAASWRRCLSKLAGFHTSPSFTPLTPCWCGPHWPRVSLLLTTALCEQRHFANLSPREFPFLAIFPLTNLTDSTVCTISEQLLLAEASVYPRPKSITHLRTFSDNGVYVALKLFLVILVYDQ